MRKAFVETLLGLAREDERIMLLTGDLGFAALEPFREAFPNRFVNVGVAEQNMVGVATGLAESGLIPFVYSIAPFAALRPYEFIRNGPLFHNLPVRVVGMGGGFDYGHAGYSHYALEDLAVMRTLPGMTVISPADSHQTASAIRATWDLTGPVYYRLGKDDKVSIPGLNGSFTIGKPDTVKSGKDGLIVVTGAVSEEAVAAAETLEGLGLSIGVSVVSTLSPVNSEALTQLIRPYRQIFAVEAHYVNGGLGSLLCEIVAENGLAAQVVRHGVRTPPHGVIGSSRYMLDRHGLRRESLSTSIRESLQVLLS